jgi:uncharacterized protein HemX
MFFLLFQAVILRKQSQPIVLIVVLAAGLVGFLVYDHIQEEKRAAELRVIEQQEREERRAKEEARKAEEKRVFRSSSAVLFLQDRIMQAVLPAPHHTLRYTFVNASRRLW